MRKYIKIITIDPLFIFILKKETDFTNRDKQLFEQEKSRNRTTNAESKPYLH